MPHAEALECRALCSATAVGEASAAPAAAVAARPVHYPPAQLLNVRLTGAPKAATGMVLTFSGSLDPSLAADPASYRVVGKAKVEEFISYGGLAERVRGRVILPLAGAVYDDAARTVTLQPRKPFNVERYLRSLVVNPALCSGAAGVERDLFDDRRGLVMQFRELQVGRTIRYLDADGSVVRLRLSGPGRLMLLARRDGSFVRNWDRDPWEVKSVRYGEGVQLWVDRAASDTVLTGSVSPGFRGGDLFTSLVQIVNPGGGRIDLLSNPAFRVGSVTTSAAAAAL